MGKLNKDAFDEMVRIRRCAGITFKGRFWFSKRQRQILDRCGRDRFFFRRADGLILEYTEMIDAEDLRRYPALAPVDFPDAVLLGDGEYYGWAPM